MPVRPTIDGLVRCAVSGTYEGEPFVNVFHFKDQAASGPTILTDLNALITALNTSGAGGTGRTFWVGMYGLMDTELSVTQAVFETYNGAASYQRVESIVGAGTSSGGNIAPYNSVLVKWTDGSISRQGKGRTYLPGLNVGMVAVGNTDQLDATFRASVVTRMNQVIAGVSATSAFDLAVYSRDAGAATVILSASVDETVAIQRRRRTSTR